MQWDHVQKAFEIGVKQALEFLKEAKSRELREQLAASGERVLEAMQDEVRKGSGRP